MQMNNGWDHDFDLQDIPEEIIRAIKDNLKKWDDAAQIWHEEMLKRKQEEIEWLMAEHDKLVDNKEIREVSKPKYLRCFNCPCMNDGDGGMVIDGIDT